MQIADNDSNGFCPLSIDMCGISRSGFSRNELEFCKTQDWPFEFLGGQTKKLSTPICSVRASHKYEKLYLLRKSVVVDYLVFRSNSSRVELGIGILVGSVRFIASRRFAVTNNFLFLLRKATGEFRETESFLLLFLFAARHL